MKKFHYLDTIISPNVTEKSTQLSEFNKVVFRVHKGSNKKAIKKSIEKLFKVNVIKINTINLRGKTKLVRNRKVFKSSQKKAIVTLKKGQSIDLGSGV
jgi:large subunit ribosomal protein L23